MNDVELTQVRADIQGDTELAVCNEEAGSFSRLWGRNCWVADTVLKLIQCSVEEEIQSRTLDDPLYKVHLYCYQLREKNRIGEFPDVIGG